MKYLAQFITVLAAAATLLAVGAAYAGTPVTMRDFTAPRDADYEKWVRESAGKKAKDPAGTTMDRRKVCRAESCPVRPKAPAENEPAPKPAPFIGGLKLLPR